MRICGWIALDSFFFSGEFDLPLCPGQEINSFSQPPVDFELVFKRLKSRVESNVVRAFGISLYDFTAANRGPQQVALARQVAMYIAHTSFGMSLTATGRLFGRDRTTVSHACSIVEDKRDDANFDYLVELIDRLTWLEMAPRVNADTQKDKSLKQ